MISIPQFNLDGLGGEYVLTSDIEKKIADFVGAKHCIMVSNGTVAIFLALRAVNARRVALPALTMFGTAAAADLAGCEIVLVANNELPDDVDTYVHVSLNGRGEGVETLRTHYPNVTIIEDAAQSLGSRHTGVFLGTFGDAGCYSFSPHKILSAGNGGCVVTNSDRIANDVRALKNFGRSAGGADIHDRIGYNFKFTDIQARFMLEQWPSLEARLERKRSIYERYASSLGSCMLPHEDTPWFVDYYVEGDRQAFVDRLAEQGIGTRVMYPLLNTQKPFAHLEIHGDALEMKRRAEQGVWLPSHPSLTDEQIDSVISAIIGV